MEKKGEMSNKQWSAGSVILAVVLILACLAMAYIMAFGVWYELPWFDVDPLVGP